MTACSAALLGQALAVAWWVLFFGGLLILWRRTVVARRRAERRQAAALRALARQHPTNPGLRSVPRPPRYPSPGMRHR